VADRPEAETVGHAEARQARLNEAGEGR
jgi:hypothetical protein